MQVLSTSLLRMSPRRPPGGGGAGGGGLGGEAGCGSAQMHWYSPALLHSGLSPPVAVFGSRKYMVVGWVMVVRVHPKGAATDVEGSTVSA